MTSKKIIAVVGATGAQGGGLVRAILADRAARLRFARSRASPTPRRASAGAAGAEVVAADLDDTATVARAFSGAYGAYCVTFFWDHFSPDTERAEARSMAEAAKAAACSTSSGPRSRTRGSGCRARRSAHADADGPLQGPALRREGRGRRILRDAGVPTTFMLTSFYWDNLIHFGMGPKPGADGKLHFALPMGNRKLPGIAAEDIGRCAYGVFKRGPASSSGETIGIAGEHLTGAEMAAVLTSALGREVVLPGRAFRGLSQSRFPRRGRPGQHVPGQSRFQRRVPCCAQHRIFAIAESAVAIVRQLGRCEREPHPDQLIDSRARLVRQGSRC